MGPSVSLTKACQENRSSPTTSQSAHRADVGCWIYRLVPHKVFNELLRTLHNIHNRCNRTTERVLRCQWWTHNSPWAPVIFAETRPCSPVRLRGLTFNDAVQP